MSTTEIPITSLTEGDPLLTDVVPGVDVTDVTQAPAGTTKKYQRSDVINLILTLFGFSTLADCAVATVSNLTATYSNGTLGVGRTLTNAGAMSALSIDGLALSVGDRVLVKNQTNAYENGIYYIATSADIGSGSTNWVLTGATDFDTQAEILDNLIVQVLYGATNANTAWVTSVTVPVTVGTDAINFTPLSLESAIVVPLTLDKGGTSAVLTAAAGAAVYSTASAMAFLAPGSAGQLYQSGGAGAPNWTTPTYPSASGSSGKFMQADGTNNVYSAYTLPTTVPTVGKLLRSDGTNLVATTAQYPATAGTSGNILTSDGTDWSSQSAAGVGSPLTTKGDIYTFSTVNARLAVGTVDGQILQVSSAAATGLAWSTPTYPSSSGTINRFLQSDGTNNVYSSYALPASISASGTILRSDGTNYVGTTATYPNVATTTGSMLYADGTNWVASTSLWPNTVGSAGVIIRSNGTINTYSTSTFADTYAINSILYASAANTVSALAPALSSVLLSSAASTGVPIWSGALSDGEIIIGSTGAIPVVASITGGAGISVTPGAGSITISTTGSGLGWNSIAGTTQAAAADSGYYCANAGATTITLPATCALGQVVLVEGTVSGGSPWILTANTGQTIQVGTSATSSGGTLTAAAATDNIEVVCLVANTTWRVQRTNSAGLIIA